MTSKQEMLGFPHKDGIVSYLKHGWNGWDSPGSVYPLDVNVSSSTSGARPLTAFDFFFYTDFVEFSVMYTHF